VQRANFERVEIAIDADHTQRITKVD
jgi:hypothetical protein